MKIGNFSKNKFAKKHILKEQSTKIIQQMRVNTDI